MDHGLKNVWDYLTIRYEGLDKASIIRLALNDLAETKKKEGPQSMLEVLTRTDKDLLEEWTDDDVFEWWNQNKKEILAK